MSPSAGAAVSEALPIAIDWRRPWVHVPEIGVLICMAALPLVLFTNVLARYTGWFATPWAADLARVCFFWGSFLGAALAVKLGGHVRLALLSNRVAQVHDGRYQNAVTIIVHGSILLLGLFLAIIGWEIVGVSMKRTMSALPIPRGLVDSAVPIGGALMVFYSARAMWNELRETSA